MGEEVKRLVVGLRTGQVNVDLFCGQFKKLVERRVSLTSGNLFAQLSNLRQAIDIYAAVRPSLPNNNIVEVIGKELFIICARVLLSVPFLAAPKHLELSYFRASVTKAEAQLRDDGHGHRFAMLKWLMEFNWKHPVLQALITGKKISQDLAMHYITKAEFPEVFRLRVEMLLEEGDHDLALNLCLWCSEDNFLALDPFIRASELILLFNRGHKNFFYEKCRAIHSCTAVEILRSVDPDARVNRGYLVMAQCFFIQEWFRPCVPCRHKIHRYCCTKALVELWLEAEYLQEPSIEEFQLTISQVVMKASSTYQLMVLVDAIYAMFGTELQGMMLNICRDTLQYNRQLLERMITVSEMESERIMGTLAYVCITLARIANDWSNRLRVYALLSAITLEPREDILFALMADRTVKKDGQAVNVLSSADKKVNHTDSACKREQNTTTGVNKTMGDVETTVNNQLYKENEVWMMPGGVEYEVVIDIVKSLEMLRLPSLNPNQPKHKLLNSCVDHLRESEVSLSGPINIPQENILLGSSQRDLYDPLDLLYKKPDMTVPPGSGLQTLHIPHVTPKDLLVLSTHSQVTPQLATTTKTVFQPSVMPQTHGPAPAVSQTGMKGHPVSLPTTVALPVPVPGTVAVPVPVPRTVAAPVPVPATVAISVPVPALQMPPKVMSAACNASYLVKATESPSINALQSSATKIPSTPIISHSQLASELAKPMTSLSSALKKQSHQMINRLPDNLLETINNTQIPVSDKMMLLQQSDPVVVIRLLQQMTQKRTPALIDLTDEVDTESDEEPARSSIAASTHFRSPLGIARETVSTFAATIRSASFNSPAMNVIRPIVPGPHATPVSAPGISLHRPVPCSPVSNPMVHALSKVGNDQMTAIPGSSLSKDHQEATKDPVLNHPFPPTTLLTTLSKNLQLPCKSISSVVPVVSLPKTFTVTQQVSPPSLSTVVTTTPNIALSLPHILPSKDIVLSSAMPLSGTSVVPSGARLPPFPSTENTLTVSSDRSQNALSQYVPVGSVMNTTLPQSSKSHSVSSQRSKVHLTPSRLGAALKQHQSLQSPRSSIGVFTASKTSPTKASPIRATAQTESNIVSVSPRVSSMTNVVQPASGMYMPTGVNQMVLQQGQPILQAGQLGHQTMIGGHTVFDGQQVLGGQNILSGQNIIGAQSLFGGQTIVGSDGLFAGQNVIIQGQDGMLFQTPSSAGVIASHRGLVLQQPGMVLPTPQQSVIIQNPGDLQTAGALQQVIVADDGSNNLLFLQSPQIIQSPLLPHQTHMAGQAVTLAQLMHPTPQLGQVAQATSLASQLGQVLPTAPVGLHGSPAVGQVIHSPQLGQIAPSPQLCMMPSPHSDQLVHSPQLTQVPQSPCRVLQGPQVGQVIQSPQFNQVLQSPRLAESPQLNQIIASNQARIVQPPVVGQVVQSLTPKRALPPVQPTQPVQVAMTSRISASHIVSASKTIDNVKQVKPVIPVSKMIVTSEPKEVSVTIAKKVVSQQASLPAKLPHASLSTVTTTVEGQGSEPPAHIRSDTGVIQGGQIEERHIPTEVPQPADVPNELENEQLQPDVYTSKIPSESIVPEPGSAQVLSEVTPRSSEFVTMSEQQSAEMGDDLNTVQSSDSVNVPDAALAPAANMLAESTDDDDDDDTLPASPVAEQADDGGTTEEASDAGICESDPEHESSDSNTIEMDTVSTASIDVAASHALSSVTYTESCNNLVETNESYESNPIMQTAILQDSVNEPETPAEPNITQPTSLTLQVSEVPHSEQTDIVQHVSSILHDSEDIPHTEQEVNIAQPASSMLQESKEVPQTDQEVDIAQPVLSVPQDSEEAPHVEQPVSSVQQDSVKEPDTQIELDIAQPVPNEASDIKTNETSSETVTTDTSPLPANVSLPGQDFNADVLSELTGLSSSASYQLVSSASVVSGGMTLLPQSIDGQPSAVLPDDALGDVGPEVSDDAGQTFVEETAESQDLLVGLTEDDGQLPGQLPELGGQLNLQDTGLTMTTDMAVNEGGQNPEEDFNKISQHVQKQVEEMLKNVPSDGEELEEVRNLMEDDEDLEALPLDQEAQKQLAESEEAGDLDLGDVLNADQAELLVATTQEVNAPQESDTKPPTINMNVVQDSAPHKDLNEAGATANVVNTALDNDCALTIPVGDTEAVRNVEHGAVEDQEVETVECSDVSIQCDIPDEDGTVPIACDPQGDIDTEPAAINEHNIQSSSHDMVENKDETMPVTCDPQGNLDNQNKIQNASDEVVEELKDSDKSDDAVEADSDGEISFKDSSLLKLQSSWEIPEESDSGANDESPEAKEKSPLPEEGRHRLRRSTRTRVSYEEIELCEETEDKKSNAKNTRGRKSRSSSLDKKEIIEKKKNETDKAWDSINSAETTEEETCKSSSEQSQNVVSKFEVEEAATGVPSQKEAEVEATETVQEPEKKAATGVPSQEHAEAEATETVQEPKQETSVVEPAEGKGVKAKQETVEVTQEVQDHEQGATDSPRSMQINRNPVRLPRLPRDQLLGGQMRPPTPQPMSSSEKHREITLISQEAIAHVQAGISLCDDMNKFQDSLIKALEDGIARRNFQEKPQLQVSKDLNSLTILLFYESGRDPLRLIVKTKLDGQPGQQSQNASAKVSKPPSTVSNVSRVYNRVGAPSGLARPSPTPSPNNLVRRSPVTTPVAKLSGNLTPVVQNKGISIGATNKIDRVSPVIQASGAITKKLPNANQRTNSPITGKISPKAKIIVNTVKKVPKRDMLNNNKPGEEKSVEGLGKQMTEGPAEKKRKTLSDPASPDKQLGANEIKPKDSTARSPSKPWHNLRDMRTKRTPAQSQSPRSRPLFTVRTVISPKTSTSVDNKVIASQAKPQDATVSPPPVKTPELPNSMPKFEKEYEKWMTSNRSFPNKTALPERRDQGCSIASKDTIHNNPNPGAAAESSTSAGAASYQSSYENWFLGKTYNSAKGTKTNTQKTTLQKESPPVKLRVSPAEEAFLKIIGKGKEGVITTGKPGDETAGSDSSKLKIVQDAICSMKSNSKIDNPSKAVAGENLQNAPNSSSALKDSKRDDAKSDCNSHSSVSEARNAQSNDQSAQHESLTPISAVLQAKDQKPVGDSATTNIKRTTLTRSSRDSSVEPDNKKRCLRDSNIEPRRSQERSVSPAVRNTRGRHSSTSSTESGSRDFRNKKRMSEVETLRLSGLDGRNMRSSSSQPGKRRTLDSVGASTRRSSATRRQSLPSKRS